MKLIHTPPPDGNLGVAREILELPDGDGHGSTAGRVVDTVLKMYDASGSRDLAKEIQFADLICDAKRLKALNAEMLEAMEAAQATLGLLVDLGYEKESPKCNGCGSESGKHLRGCAVDMIEKAIAKWKGPIMPKNEEGPQ